MKTTSDVPRILLDTAEAAKAMGCDRKTIYDLMKAGKLKGVRLADRSWRFRPAELERCALALEAGPTTEAT